jgi:hypothetical protein
MYFQASLIEAQAQKGIHKVPEELILPHNPRIHFINKFKYLGCIVTLPPLNEDAEIDARIKKAKPIMDASKHFFDNNGVDCRVKTQIYTAAPLNALLWGCKSWNLMRRNLNKLRSFHHGAIRRILKIKLREGHIKNLEVRCCLYNMPNIDALSTEEQQNMLAKYRD